MKIILLRHGKPEISALKKLSASAFGKWISDYNAAGLSAESKPTPAALACANRSHAIVCSSLQRSIDSANALGAKKIVLSDAVFNEAGLPSANWHLLKLPPTIWAVFFRVLWMFGYSRCSESINETQSRAINAIKVLVALAEKNEKVIFVGHGVFNRLLAKELKRSGWVGPRNPGSNYWDYGVYSL